MLDTIPRKRICRIQFLRALLSLRILIIRLWVYALIDTLLYKGSVMAVLLLG